MSWSACQGDGRLAAVVAIPARNEAARIGACLDALSVQAGVMPGALGILILVNNTTDATREIVAERRTQFACPFRVVERNHVAAGAGWARREAMEEGASWLETSGATDAVLLTSDADSQVAPDWVGRNLAAIDAGADLVCGMFKFDPREPLPADLTARTKLEADYEARLAEIGTVIDPQPGNPWPTHWSTSGASLAVRLSVYRRVGGMPALLSGEDAAFVERVRAEDFVVRSDPTIVVVTSGRFQGRATGGTADTIALRHARPDTLCDPRLERIDRAIFRMLWRKQLRRLHASGELRPDGKWAERLAVPAIAAAAASQARFTGQAIATIEAASPKLVSVPQHPSALPVQTLLARALLMCLKLMRRGNLARPARRWLGLLPQRVEVAEID